MITLYLIAIIVYLITLAASILNNGNLARNIISPIVFTLAISIVSAIVIAMISDIYIRAHSKELIYRTEEISYTNIKTISDDAINVTGTFTLGFGEINSEAKFYFYEYSSDSSFYLKSIKAEDVNIIESNYKNPCIIKYKKYIDWNKTESSGWLFELLGETQFYNIYVPKNTIITKYNLDAR